MLNRFITVEGGEGVGKSLFCSKLLAKLQLYHLPVLATREPGGSKLAEKIRQLFIATTEGETINPEAELFLLSAARSQHVTNLILPNLGQGKWVLCDRFADSTRAYQGHIGGIDPAFLESVISRSTHGLTPQLTFLLDCPVELSLSRIDQRALLSAARTEKKAGKILTGDQGALRYDEADMPWHQKLRSAYLQLASQFPERIYVLDASQTADVVVEQAFAQLKKVFRLD